MISNLDFVPSLFAANEPELIAAVAFGAMFLLTPIILILTNHQRKMAEILNAKQAQDPRLVEEVLRLRDEVSRLRTDLNSATISLDDLKGKQPQRPDPPSLQQRISQ